MKKNKEIKKIIITGASSGLGKELAIELSKKKCELFITGSNKTELIKTFTKLKGDNHKYFVFDLSNFDKINTLISKIFKNDKRYDGFIHCAGKHFLSPLSIIDEISILETYNVNVFSPLLIIKEFSKKNNHNKNSSILFISSVSSFIGSSSLSLYGSSKAAQIGLTKSLAVELAKKEIRVNSISSSFFESKIYEKVKSKIPSESLNKIKDKHLLGIGKYSNVIPMILHLLSNDSKWTTGSNIIVDGGYSSN